MGNVFNSGILIVVTSGILAPFIIPAIFDSFLSIKFKNFLILFGGYAVFVLLVSQAFVFDQVFLSWVVIFTPLIIVFLVKYTAKSQEKYELIKKYHLGTVFVILLCIGGLTVTSWKIVRYVSTDDFDGGQLVRESEVTQALIEYDSDIEKKLRVVITSAGDPIPWTKKIHKAGLLHAHVAASTKHALRVEKSGRDFVIASGYEAGGHIALVPVHTFVLVPEVVNNVKIPVVAAGGMADGKSLAAALAFGAVGIQMGTRFIATVESDFKDNYKNSFQKAEETDTTVLPGFFSPHCRYLKNAWTKGLEELLQKGASEDEILRYKIMGRSLAAEKGDENGSLLCGMVVGRIKSIKTVREVIEDTVKEAEKIIKNMQKLIISS